MSEIMFLTILLVITANLYKTIDGVSMVEAVIPSINSFTGNKRSPFSMSIKTTGADVTQQTASNKTTKKIESSARPRGKRKKEGLLSVSSDFIQSGLNNTKYNKTVEKYLCYHNCTCTKLKDKSIHSDCSRLDLTYIPKFHSDVTYINLHENALTAVPDSVSFPANVTYIDLSLNIIKWIAEGVFRQLSRLRYLDISHNLHLSLEVMPNVTLGLNDSELKTLKFNSIQCDIGIGAILKRDHLINLQNTTLQEIYCERNAIRSIENGVLRNLPSSMRLISFSNNKVLIWQWLEFMMLPNIRSINVSGMPTLLDELLHFSFVCLHDNPKHRDKLGILNYLFSSLTFYGRQKMNITFYFPETLEVIDFSKSMFQLHSNNNEFFVLVPNIKIVHLDGNYLKELYHKGLYRSKTEVVSLSNNYCTFISPEHFIYAVNMRKLYLDNNYLGDYLSSQKASSLFQNQAKLHILDLSYNGITVLTKNLFFANSALTHLNLAGNKLSEITFEIAHMTHLMMLDLSENRIRFLNRSNMQDLDRISDYHNVTIDLTGNELLCTCDTIDFLEWIRRHTISRSITFRNYNTYQCTCTNSSEMMLHEVVANIDTLTLHCSSHIGLIIGCVLGIVIFLSTVLLSVLYRYRWKIRYLYFTTKRAFSDSQPQNDTIYRYNIFLSYAEEDSDLALEVILPYLEKDGNTKVCCHTRDFTPGRTVADNIAKAIHDSHFTLCVISGNYVKSYWCMYEFNLAKMESEYARGGVDVLFLILCKDIVPKSIPLNLMHHIKSRSYLEVPDKDDMASTETFLERLKMVMS